MKKSYRKFDPDNDSVIFRYSMDSPMGYIDIERYVNEVHIDIIGRTLDGIEFKMGEAERKLLLLTQAINDNVDPLYVFDYTQSLMDIGDAIYDFDQGCLKDEVASVSSLENSDICVFERLCILPAYRGMGLAKKLIKDNVVRLGNSCGLFVMKPFPLQCEGTFGGDIDSSRTSQYGHNRFEAEMGYDEMEMDPDKAIRQLVKYYKSIGYFTIKGQEGLMFISPSMINKKLDKIDLNELGKISHSKNKVTQYDIPLEAYTIDMTTKAALIFKDAEKQFEKYADGTLETETLENLHYVLSECSDDFLDRFSIEYNTEVNTEDDIKPFYDNPEVTFGLLDNLDVYFTVRCSGYRCSRGMLANEKDKSLKHCLDKEDSDYMYFHCTSYAKNNNSKVAIKLLDYFSRNFLIPTHHS